MKKIFPLIILFFVFFSCEEGSLDEDITNVNDEEEIDSDKEDENTDPVTNKSPCTYIFPLENIACG